MRRLTAVVERSAVARHQARVGKVGEVLVEGPSKKDATMTEETRFLKLAFLIGLSSDRLARRVISAP